MQYAPLHPTPLLALSPKTGRAQQRGRWLLLPITTNIIMIIIITAIIASIDVYCYQYC